MKKLIVYFLLFFSLPFLAQNKDLLSKNLFKINMIYPGLSYERSITRTNTLSFDAKFFPLFLFKSDIPVFQPIYFDLQYRFYYNLEKRQAKGKSIMGNSGGFVAIDNTYFSSVQDKYHTYDGYTLSTVWGFQKTYNFGLNLSAHAGLGYNFSTNVTKSVVPMLGFSVAWVISK